MQRYFVPAINFSDNTVTIEGDDVHHITRVMRMESGDEIICNHPSGKAAICKILTVSDQEVVVSINNWLEQSAELPIHVTVAQGLPKGDKLELILQKGTELGATGFIPFQASRSVVKWDNKKVAKKIERFKKIVKEASEQSHRTILPHVESIETIQSLVANSAFYDHKFVAYEETTRELPTKKLSYYFDQITTGEKVLICIGPEGGFSESEITKLHTAGFESIRLGPRILRTETAALYALASLSYHFEERE
ncbi:ribosomal RNA small subunit methyltransferase E [Paraliobacillus quinghaiensis]|uniref:Ribosomal RNA small subunit methyltransferase E n=1 Tax=Paraliobacillus quinghaiensis TaxID=470815 RepID=A0A917TPN4_9BACI|nr:16S rRNA (uracil(1498)-N(3))-methyltransferase [Paraliobacillus quinghaiensis]GGM31185.1 ribosomal RNA small subunit methyltransferase E [Paraliobacillus quinghaiensis]